MIVENLGAAGPADVETLAIIREHGLADAFSPEVLADARAAIEGFDAQASDGREDLTGLTIVTIDPDTARDYDDALSLQRVDGRWRLGVHIADVSSFVRPDAPLDVEARTRGNSVYFPRKVLPMLPESLSNGVCSLQEGQVRYVKSAFIDYDDRGAVLGTRFADAAIRSASRLTYKQAQAIIDGQIGGYAPEVVRLLRDANTLARVIEARRRAAGMLHLDLPEVELVLSPDGRVIDAVKADDSYTHTIIEMFMVEANEAVARLLNGLNVPFLRRIHPESDMEGSKHLNEFIRACGHKIAKHLTRRDMQELIEAVRGRPESYAVNLALLKTFEQAEYSPRAVGHFALGSEHYCHFTSPIRRYADLTVHRLLERCLRGEFGQRRHGGRSEGRLASIAAGQDMGELIKLAEHCSYTDRRAQQAEDDLRTVLILQLLSEHLGDTMEGVITGVTNFGIFVQSTKYLIEGLVKLEDLGDDWWEPDPAHGQIVAQRSGRRIRLGNLVTARILRIDMARRQLNLVLESSSERPPKHRGKGRKKGQRLPEAAQAKAHPPAQQKQHQAQPPARPQPPHQGRKPRPSQQTPKAPPPAPASHPPAQAAKPPGQRRDRAGGSGDRLSVVVTERLIEGRPGASKAAIRPEGPTGFCRGRKPPDWSLAVSEAAQRA